MAYVHFDPTLPDPASETIVEVGTSTRANQEALRDMCLMGNAPGWDFEASGVSPEQPSNLLYSKGAERLRAAITWGGSGGATGNPASIVWDYSADSGGSYSTIGTITYTYSAGGVCTAYDWS